MKSSNSSRNWQCMTRSLTEGVSPTLTIAKKSKLLSKTSQTTSSTANGTTSARLIPFTRSERYSRRSGCSTDALRRITMRFADKSKKTLRRSKLTKLPNRSSRMKTKQQLLRRVRCLCTRKPNPKRTCNLHRQNKSALPSTSNKHSWSTSKPILGSKLMPMSCVCAKLQRNVALISGA